MLPTAAYVGGPAEIAYFAQSAVVYEKILGRVTPVLPRLSATLVEPAIAKVLAQHELELPQIFEAKTVDALAQRLGARAMPIEGKRKLAAVGNAMDAELTALTEYMTAMSADLGRSAEVSASKMRYQMDRLRRMAADFPGAEGSVAQEARDGADAEPCFRTRIRRSGCWRGSGSWRGTVRDCRSCWWSTRGRNVRGIG